MEVFPAPRNPVKTVIGIWGGCLESIFTVALGYRSTECVFIFGRRIVNQNHVTDGISNLVVVTLSRRETRFVLQADYDVELLLAMVGRKQPPTSVPGVRAQRLVINASHVAATHTYLALAAFGLALLLGCALHYKKIVKNGVAGYPDEWFPSVSATYVRSSSVGSNIEPDMLVPQYRRLVP